jgi:hypothetical protein
MPLYRTLTEPELDRVKDGVALAGRLAGAEGRPIATELQALYDVLLQDLNGAEAAIEGLGYAFGSLFLEYDWLHWVMMLDDEFGDEVAIVVRDRELGCSPLSMIRNRLQDREACDLAELAASTVARLRQLGQQAASA